MDDESTPIEPQTPPQEMQYEETPILTPVVETPPPQDEPPAAEPAPEQQEPAIPYDQPVSPPKKRPIASVIKGFFIFLILFIIGYALSGVIRTVIMTPAKQTIKPTPTTSPIATNITPMETEATESSIPMLAAPLSLTTPTAPASSSAWKPYNPLRGSTRTPITTIQFSLPGTILAPICDGTSCGSQGTYLPGGTRLTIAPRGTGEVLADYRGKIISDASGKALITKETTIGGKKATEYTTDTTGSTVGGYAFTTMHGYMIEVTDTLSFEINHFSPSGIKTDFATDDALFKSIVATIVFK